MLDIKWIRSNPDLFKAAMIKRGLAAFDHPANKAILERNGNPEEPDKKLAILLQNAKEAVVEKILPLEDLDKKRREMIAEVEKLQAEKNAANKEIGRKKAAKEPCEDLFAGMKQMSNKIKELDKALEEQENQFTDLLMNIPNAPHESVPLGFDEKANVEVKRWGTPKEYGFEVKDHVDLGANLGILDFDRAAKISGARFSILTGNGARLERAIMNFMLDTHTQKHGYREVEPPVIVNSSAL
ncbi:MAG: hypothetical protein IKP71_08965, partial [Candidatus Riflebacteria bacterium]|nr:hypothetical protein [Candidatus Riflebacteria bacterium]